ncbi:hypothetical protein SAMN05518863_10763 [Candidatus Pantoea symbiotica]|jgi:hypothetical protein|uniref:Bacterial Ig-like domain-containing protein n=1 Tax=Candidatus Pantoea symbiotica TaxID=1884370 RepID=A0A1I3ZJX2_9GAMM|nr:MULTISPECIES: Ig-like domain-containing protein [Pantoea]KAJ9430019.1 Ig-like domain-containing protein [Pantoea sp. YR343]SFK44378.1 hypothetical protein SAMN05518863_10763 [Pantoea symbiotica]SFU93264.1 hypothetical protein SAMN05518864_107262 [Pantoea sp. YR525]
MNSSVNIIAVQGKEVVAAAEGTANNAPAHLKAQPGAKYLLAAGTEGKPAPLDGNVIVKRNGKNLEIFADDDDSRPEFIIEDYFSQPGDIAALGNDGQYHLLVAEQTESSAFLLDDGATLALMPGSALTGLTGLAVAAGISTGWLIAGGIAGLLALGGIAAAAGGGGGGGDESGNGGSDELPVPAPAPVDISNVIISDNVGSVQGPVAPGGVTDDARVVLAGNGTPGSVIRIYDNGQLIGSTVIDDAGLWSWQPEQPLSAGSHELSFSEVNPAGEEGPLSAGVSFELDLTAPGRVENFTLTDKVGSSHGPVQPGDTFNDTRPVFSGRAEPGATVEIRDNGELIGSALVGSDGAWSWQPDTDFADGEHNFSVIVVDPAGNSGLPVEFGSVIIDSGLDETPAFDTITDNSGRELADGDATNANPLRLGGEGQPGDIVTVIVDGEAVGSLVIDADGSWSYDLVLPNEGNFEVGFTISNPEGDLVGRSDSIELIYDTTAPDAPVLGNVTDGEGNPVVSGESNVKNPIFSGSGANPGDTVWLYDGADRIGSTTVDENGNWQIIAPTLEEGSHDLNLRFEDAAGNLSDASDNLYLESDFTAPTAPVLGDVLDENGDLVLPGASNVKNPIFSGDNANPGDIVYLYDGEQNPIASVVVGADGKWEIVSPDLDEGTHDLNLRFEDAAGNLSDASDSLQLEIDLTAPDAPVIADVTDEYGNVIQPGDSNVKNPVFSGTGSAGDIVYLYDGNNTPIASSVVGSDGRWEIVSPDLDEGSHDLNLRFEDAAGNLSDPSASFNLETDLTAPDVAVVESISDSSGTVKGDLADGSWTDEKNPVFSGKSNEAGLIVELLDKNNNVIGTAITDSLGNWTVTPGTALTNGDWELRVRLTDAAGNSSTSNATTLHIDDTVPAVSSITTVIDNYGLDTGVIANEGVTDDLRPMLQGKGPENGTVILFQDGVEVGRIDVDVNGDWSWQPGNDLSFDNYAFTVKSLSQSGVINDQLSDEYVVKVAENAVEGFESFTPGSSFASGTKMTDFTINYSPNVATLIGTGDRGPEFSGNFLTFRQGDIDIDIELDDLAYKMSFSLFGMSGPNYEGYVTFYDQNGQELDKVPIGGGSLIFSYDSKPGELISKATVTVRNDTSGFDLDNIQVYKANAADIAANTISSFGASEDDSSFLLSGHQLMLTNHESVFDFASLAEEHQQQEIHSISLEGHGINMLNISAADVLAFGNEDLFLHDGSKQLMINGDAGDIVNLEALLPDGATASSWNNLGAITVGGVSYDVYHSDVQDVELLIQQGMQVNNNH